MADGDIPIEDVLEDDSETVTIWAPEPSNGTDEVVTLSVDKWMESVSFETTEDVPIPDRLVDQVIGTLPIT